MSWLSDYLRRRRIDPVHQTRRHLSRHVAKRGFEIGDYTYGRPLVRIDKTGGRLFIGSYCSIASEVEIIIGGNHRSDWVSTYPFRCTSIWQDLDDDISQFISKGDVVIGCDVWIGTGATILSGVSIGHGAIIGARAVVSRNVPPYVVAVGNPARVVRQRFTDDVIDALLEIRWWDRGNDAIAALLPLIQSDDVDGLLNECRRLGYLTSRKITTLHRNSTS